MRCYELSRGLQTEIIEERRAQVEKRSTVIGAVEGLRERELLKLAALSDVIADALRSRGVTETRRELGRRNGRDGLQNRL